MQCLLRIFERGIEFARQLESGMAHVNDQTVNSAPNTPFGGVKASGLGRYGGEWGFEEFTSVKWVSVQRNVGTIHFKLGFCYK